MEARAAYFLYILCFAAVHPLSKEIADLVVIHLPVVEGIGIIKNG